MYVRLLEQQLAYQECHINVSYYFSYSIDKYRNDTSRGVNGVEMPFCTLLVGIKWYNLLPGKVSFLQLVLRMLHCLGPSFTVGIFPKEISQIYFKNYCQDLFFFRAMYHDAILERTKMSKNNRFIEQIIGHPFNRILCSHQTM